MKQPSVDWKKKPKIVIFDGDEPYFKEKEIKRALDILKGYQVDRFKAGDSSKEMAASLFEGSLFSVKKCVIIREANTLKDHDFLLEYIKKPNPDITLILEVEGRELKWFKKITGERYTYKKLRDYETSQYLVTLASDRGFTLSKAYASSIIANVGMDLHVLESELEKIFLYVGEGQRITASDVTKVLVQHAQMSMFDLIEAWVHKKKPVCLKLLALLYYQAPKDITIPLIAVFMNHVRGLLSVKSFSALNPNTSGAPSLGMNPYIYKKYAEQKDLRNKRELLDAYNTLCEIDYLVKVGRNGKHLLEAFIAGN